MTCRRPRSRAVRRRCRARGSGTVRSGSTSTSSPPKSHFNRRYRNAKRPLLPRVQAAWPNLADWFVAPLAERVGRLPGERQPARPTRSLSGPALPALPGTARLHHLRLPVDAGRRPAPGRRPGRGAGHRPGHRSAGRGGRRARLPPGSARPGDALDGSAGSLLHTGVPRRVDHRGAHHGGAGSCPAVQRTPRPAPSSIPRRSTTGTTPPRPGSPICTSSRSCCSTAARSPPSRAS